jgi:hypothetical protein
MYVMEKGAAFGPAAPAWIYTPAAGTSAFYAANISGATRLPNGNTLACFGPQGMLVEVTSDGDIVWRYISPVGMNGTVRQGQIPQNSMIFKVYRYGADHPALAGRNLRPRGRLEDGPLSVSAPTEHSDTHVTFIPGSSIATIHTRRDITVRIDAFDVLGRWLGVVYNGLLSHGTTQLNVPAGAIGIRCLL